MHPRVEQRGGRNEQHRCGQAVREAATEFASHVDPPCLTLRGVGCDPGLARDNRSRPIGMCAPFNSDRFRIATAVGRNVPGLKYAGCEGRGSPVRRGFGPSGSALPPARPSCRGRMNAGAFCPRYRRSPTTSAPFGGTKRKRSASCRRIALEAAEGQHRHVAERVLQLHRSRQVVGEADAHALEAGVGRARLRIDIFEPVARAGVGKIEILSRARCRPASSAAGVDPSARSSLRTITWLRSRS